MTIGTQQRDMSFDEFLDFLEPNEVRGGAVCQSASDMMKIKNALEQLCRLAGKYCTYEQRQMISNFNKSLNVLNY